MTPLEDWLRAERPRWVLGTMNFGGRTPETEARAILDRALELGISHVDSANAYANGDSERIVGRWLSGVRRGAVIVTTKIGLGRLGGPPEGLAPGLLPTAVRASLDRLGVETIDLLYLHRPDPTTPIEATLSALAPLLGREIGAYGLSNYGAWQTLEVIQAAGRLGLPPPAAGQLLYNFVLRGLELEYLDFAARYGLHTSVFNPLAGGLLTGRYEAGRAPEPGSRMAESTVYRRRYLAPALRALADAFAGHAALGGVEPAVLAYRWLLAEARVGSIVLGPSSAAHLDAAVRAAEAPLTRPEHRALEKLHDEVRGREESYARGTR